MSKNRIEAFSDGVFAIVITLLILDIRVPDVEYSQLEAAFVPLLPRIFAYIISFGVIGVYWVAHHQSLQLIKQVNGYLLWLNLLYLLAVSFMPFPTALLGRYPGQPIPIVVYSCNLVTANLIGLLLRLYLRAHPELGRNYSLGPQKKSLFMYIFVNVSYAIAMVLGFYVPLVSYGIFVIVLIVVILYYSATPRPAAGEITTPTK